jgi:hypothetical protein
MIYISLKTKKKDKELILPKYILKYHQQKKKNHSLYFAAFVN